MAVTGKPALVVYGPEGGRAAEQMRAGGFQSAAAAPIRVRGSLWGVVSLTSKSRTGVTEAMMERLAQFAELVEIAIGNTEARTDLELQATTDALSGLPNRRALERHLAEQVALAGSRGTNLSAVVLDIDHFKRINDTYGHLMGDAVLAEVAARLRRGRPRQGDRGPVRRRGVRVAAPGDRRRRGPAGGRTGPGGHRVRTVRGGRFPDRSPPASASSATPRAGSLLDCADRALYEAKNGGRNRTSRYGHPSQAVPSGREHTLGTARGTADHAGA